MPDCYDFIVLKHTFRMLPVPKMEEGMTFKGVFSMLQSEKQNHIAIASSAITGTTFMTLFSYLVARLQKENFREPELLATLLRRLAPALNRKYSHVAGWNIHYAVGFVFAIVYARLWQQHNLKPSAKSGLVLGALSGLLAILVWRSTFRLHPSPPKIHFKRFYGHLFLAHLVFGTFAAIGYKITSRTFNMHKFWQNRSK